jgi:PAS domain S-box-containing protein
VSSHAIFRLVASGAACWWRTRPPTPTAVHAGAKTALLDGVPLLAGRELIGIYAVDKREAGFFGAQHLRLTEALAPQAVIAIRNARLFRRCSSTRPSWSAAWPSCSGRPRAARERAAPSAIIETARDAFVAIDAAGYITGWNRQAELTFGWNRADVLGRSLAETIIPPAYREAHRAGLSRFLAAGEGNVFDRRLELVALHRDGHEIPVELTVSAMRAGPSWVFNAFLRDISERRRDERRRTWELAASAISPSARGSWRTVAEGRREQRWWRSWAKDERARRRRHAPGSIRPR